MRMAKYFLSPINIDNSWIWRDVVSITRSIGSCRQLSSSRSTAPTISSYPEGWQSSVRIWSSCSLSNWFFLSHDLPSLWLYLPPRFFDQSHSICLHQLARAKLYLLHSSKSHFLNCMSFLANVGRVDLSLRWRCFFSLPWWFWTWRYRFERNSARCLWGAERYVFLCLDR